MKPSKAISACAGIGRPVFGAADHLHRLAQQSAGRVVFVLAVRDFETCDHEQRRMHAAHHGHRARLAALVILLLDHVAVLALGAHHGGERLVVRLHPVGAVVDPAGVRIAHDHHVAGADVIAAVVLVPARHRNLEQVDVVAGLDVVQERTARDLDRRDGPRLLHVAAPMLTSSISLPSGGLPIVMLMRRIEVSRFARMRWPFG